MSCQLERTPSTRSSLERDIKPVVMAPLERKRKAEAQSSQKTSPIKSQRTSKSSNTPPKSSSSTPKNITPSLFTPQPIVTIVITSSKDPHVNQKFNIHKNILCYYTRWFDAELKSGDPYLEANPKPITLEDADTSSLGLFLNWIYYQKIRNEEGKLPGLIDLAKLWVLGEHLQISSLQNDTMDHIRDEVQYPAEFEPFIHFVYNMDGDGKMLRKLAIARLAWTLPDPFKDILVLLPAQAMMDLILELKSQRDAVPREHWRDIGDAMEFYVMEKEQTKEEV